MSWRQNSLPEKEELELTTRWTKYRDTDARDLLVTSHGWLVKHLVKRYADPLSPLGEELCQEGRLGLLRATVKFNPKNGRFSTYSKYWILAQIMRYNSRRRHHYRTHKFYGYLNLGDRGAPGTNDSELEEIIHQLENYDPTVNPEQAYNTHLDIHLVRQALADVRLEPKERFVINQRFFLDEDQPPTLKVVGAQINLTGESARRIERRALEKLKRHFKKMDRKKLAA